MQVHHASYDHIGFERDWELICLCKNCHEWIEKKKDEYERKLTPKEQRNLLEQRRYCIFNDHEYRIALQKEMFEEFVEYALPRDYANNGDLNLTNYDVIRETYETFFAKYNYAPNTYYSLLGTQVYFRNRRYEVILDYMNRNFPIEITLKMTKISPKMVRDIYNNKEKALKLLRQEERNNAET